MSDVVRIAFAGCGMVSELHAAAIGRSSRAALAGVFDPLSELAESRAQAWSCVSYASLQELLSDDAVDAVFVLTPTRTHVDVAIRALEAGKHVLVEKPVARDRDELQRLIDVAGKAATVCMPGHNYAYIPEIRRLRRLVREGHLGEIRFASVIFAIAHAEEVAAHYDGVLRLVMPHHAYLIHGVLGLPQSVYAGETESGWATLDRGDQCWMVLEYAPRATAFLFTTLAVDDDSADPWSFVVKVLGTGGSASATWRTGVFHRDIGSMSTAYAAYEEAYELELDAFCSSVGGDSGAIASPLRDAIAVEEILSAAEESIRLRRPIEVEK
jgi:predicted dehydrogenase